MFYEDDRFEYYETDELYTIAAKTKYTQDWYFDYFYIENVTDDFERKLKNELEKHIAKNKFRAQLSIVLEDND
jgi:hypothetical protein